MGQPGPQVVLDRYNSDATFRENVDYYPSAKNYQRHLLEALGEKALQKMIRDTKADASKYTNIPRNY